MQRFILGVKNITISHTRTHAGEKRFLYYSFAYYNLVKRFTLKFL